MPTEKADESDAFARMSAEETEVRRRIDQLDLAAPSDLPSAAMSGTTKRTALHLKRPWRKDIVWGRGERSGPIVQIAVSEAQADRALKLADTLLREAEGLRWSFGAPPPPPAERYRRYSPVQEPSPTPLGQLLVEGEALRFRIAERQQRSEHALTEDEKARKRRGEYVYPPRWDYAASGELRVHLCDADSDYVRQTFKDGRRLRIEDQVKPVLHALVERAFAIKQRREEDKRAEIERQRRAQLERERSERRDAELKLVVELERQAGAWCRAQMLRRYLRAARRVLGEETILVKRLGQSIDFFEWASAYVAQLDPLHEAARNADLRVDSYFAHSSDRYHEELSRLIGHAWPESWKLVGKSAEGMEASNEEEEEEES